MGVHELVTGLNGAGKTLYTVATKLRPLVGSKVKHDGRDVPRRLVVGGIPELLIPHELIEVPEVDPETFVDEWATVTRERGQPAVRWVRREVLDQKTGRSGYVACEEADKGAEPLLWTVLNWWCWCEPGDVIVIDECQNVFRPMASGRKVPKFVAKLEIARHYGVQFVYLTQHAGLLHANVRALVGPHEDVRRVFGTNRVLVYQWDKVNTAGSIAKATSRYWKHDKSAFGLYRSAQLHTKFGQRLPLAVWGVVFGLVALLSVAWIVKGRLQDRFTAKPPATTSSAAPGHQGGPMQARGALALAAGAQRWPVYRAEPAKVDREPYEGRALVWEGEWTVGGVQAAAFGIVLEGERVGTVMLSQLLRMGYAWTTLGPCVGSLSYQGQERLISCARPQPVRPQHESRPTPAPVSPASAPTT